MPQQETWRRLKAVRLVEALSFFRISAETTPDGSNLFQQIDPFLEVKGKFIFQ